VVAILLDSSLLVSASIPQQHPSPPVSAQSNASPISLLATPAGVWAFNDGRYLSANMTTRGEIMAFILTNPGVYLREISEDLGLSMGAVQYHIWVLTRDGQLEECRSGRYRRFFGAAKYQKTEQMVLSLLRQGTAGRILAALSEEPLTHARLASILGLTSQAVSWHMKRLRWMGVVEAVPTAHDGRLYCLPSRVRQEVQTHTGSSPLPVSRLLEAPSVR
jgi:predicted ArsR family transcriptional regulator